MQDYLIYRYDEDLNPIIDGNTYNIDLGPGATLYDTTKFEAYLNRADVKAAIHAPDIQYTVCNHPLQLLIQTASNSIPRAAHVGDTVMVKCGVQSWLEGSVCNLW